jgi:serine/threonine protein kinase
MSSNEPADKPPTTGLVAGKYEIVRLLGRGGMGSVWEARHNSLGTKVAIKFVEVEQAQNEEARSRFHNEALAAATIQSKHAIKVFDHGLLDDGRPYIVMELLIGEALDARLQLLQRMSLPDTARLVQQVCKALQQAHDAGITHRDLKPENIFLERNADDEEDVAKVLDFGIAKIRDAASSPIPSTTKTGVLMGTPFFMSPEQARGMKSLDHRSDLWSLAVIVFRCVTGKLPFDGESLGDLLVKICAAPVPVPSGVLPGLPQQFDQWMAKALDREPPMRFQSAHEFAESLSMVAGVSVRMSSRRSQNEFSPVPAAPQFGTTAPVPPTAQSWTPAFTPRPTTASQPGLPPLHSIQGLQAGQDMRQPIPQGTSSPFTASSPPVPMQKGIGAGALSVMAAVLLLGTAGGSFYWFTHRTTGSVVVTTEVGAHPAAAAPPPPTSAASTGAAPTASAASIPPVPPADSSAASTPQASKGTTLRGASGAAVPSEGSKHLHGGTPNPGTGTKTPLTNPVAPPSLPTPVTVPHSSAHPPSPTSGSDPGY